MGPENSSGPMVAYIDGQPVEIVHPLPEITPDYSAGGVSAEAMATASKVGADMSITIEVAVDGIKEFFRAMELSAAMWAARNTKSES